MLDLPRVGSGYRTALRSQPMFARVSGQLDALSLKTILRAAPAGFNGDDENCPRCKVFQHDGKEFMRLTHYRASSGAMPVNPSQTGGAATQSPACSAQEALKTAGVETLPGDSLTKG